MICVYKHIRNDNNEVFYIAIGSHKRAFDSKGRNQFWKNITNKTSYTIEIIENNLSWDEACILEKYWIKFYGRRNLNEGTLVNLTDGGDGNYGRVITEDVKKKLSDFNKGKKLSEEIKSKISLSLKGKKISEEQKIKLSQSLKGRYISEDHRSKISNSMKGKQSGENNPNYGKVWITNGIKNKSIKKEDIGLYPDWKFGMTFKNKVN